MPIPTPEPGLVISYAYVWSHEADAGQQEGSKDRPCVIVAAVEQKSDGTTIVTVLPVTHRPPQDAAAALEIPQGIKKRLRLDSERSWIVVSEANKFVWPGFDLRKVPGRDQFEYGFLPPRFFDSVLMAGRVWAKRGRSKITLR